MHSQPHWHELLFLVAFVGIVLSTTPGCAQLMRFEGIAADQAASALNATCKNTDDAFRQRFQAKVNEKAKPHSIAVTCGTP